MGSGLDYLPRYTWGRWREAAQLHNILSSGDAEKMKRSPLRIFPFSLVRL